MASSRSARGRDVRLGAAAALLAAALAAAAPDARADDPRAGDAEAAPPDTAERREPSRFYYGGNLGLIVSGRYTHIVIQPLVGYKLTPRASLGAKASYEYLKDRRPGPDAASHNYGASLFSRYRFVREAFAQIELAAVSYDLADGRTTVPFLLVGGGYAQPLGSGTWLVVEVLMDLIRDADSPFKDWEPRVHVGINAGF